MRMATQRKLNRQAGVKRKHITAIPSTGWTEVLLTLPSLKMEKANKYTTKFSGLSNIRKNNFKFRAKGSTHAWSCREAATSHKLTCYLLKKLVFQ